MECLTPKWTKFFTKVSRLLPSSRSKNQKKNILTPSSAIVTTTTARETADPRTPSNKAVYYNTRDGNKIRVLGVFCQECGHETEIHSVEIDDGSVFKAWGAFRRELRQILHEQGVRSNPGWSDDDVTQAFRKLFDAKR